MKRILLLVTCIIVITGLKAQVVNIPDANFKNALLNYDPAIDLNGDLQIQVSEAAAMTAPLVVDYKNITDLTGIKSFTHIDGLSVFNNNLSTLDLSGMTNIRTLVSSMNPLTSINLAGMTNLQAISCIITSLSSIDLTGLTMLYQVELSDNHLTNIIVPVLPILTSLNLRNNQLSSLTVSGSNALDNIHCENNLLTSLNISNCSNLHRLSCDFNQLQSLDLTHGLTSLTVVEANFNNLISINLSGLVNLQTAYLNNNQLATLNLNGLNNLTNVSARLNALTTLDVSGCSQLSAMNFTQNQLVYVNIKNGPTVIIDPGISGNPVQYICTDDAEVAALQTLLSAQGLTNVNINSYCSFTPGGLYNTINGTVRIDMNANGCDASDPIVAGMPVKTSNGSSVVYTSTNSTGTYASYSNSGIYTITPQPENPYFTITPASATINFTNPNNNTSTANFCLTLNAVHNDLEVEFIPVTSARPGFDAYYKLVYKNKGTSVLSGTVNLGFADDKLDLISANPGITTQSTGLLGWAYSNLQPFETRTIDVLFNLLIPPINNNGEVLTFICNIFPVAVDETPKDNNFNLRQTITGSFDPNDKACLEGDSIDITKVGDYIHYLVRFQNTGTEAAENVVVKDVLQSNLDWNSFEISKTSHPCVVKQTNGNRLEFIFQGINLPALSVDEPGSHGFIAFKIKTLGTLLIGDSVKNSADIYFDFNLPVITNTAGSVIGNIGTIPISIEYFKGNAQNGKHLLNWKANCTSLQAKFDIERSTDNRKYISISSITASNTRCLAAFDFTDNNPAAGMNYYRIRMTDIDGKISYSSIIALLNKKTGFEILNLMPNPVTNGTAALNIVSAEKQLINIIVSDASGKRVQSIDQPVIAGFTQVNMNFTKLAAGTYTIAVYTSDGKIKTKQFIKQ